MLKRFIVIALLYLPVYFATASFIYSNPPGYLPGWGWVFLPITPLFILFWWIAHREEMAWR